MKTAIIYTDGTKQIVFTPESEDEKQALALFMPDDQIELAIKQGSMYDDDKYKAFGVTAQTCNGGYIRFFQSNESRVFVLTKREEPKPVPFPAMIVERFEQTEPEYTAHLDGIQGFVVSAKTPEDCAVEMAKSVEAHLKFLLTPNPQFNRK